MLNFGCVRINDGGIEPEKMMVFFFGLVQIISPFFQGFPYWFKQKFSGFQPLIFRTRSWIRQGLMILQIYTWIVRSSVELFVAFPWKQLL